MKKKLTLLLVFALVLTMIPAPASAALKSAGSPTEVQTLVSSENLEHNFVKVTANGSTLDIEVETPVVASEYNFNVIKVGNTGGVWVGRVYERYGRLLPIYIFTTEYDRTHRRYER